jgi:hypothetical protein
VSHIPCVIERRAGAHAPSDLSAQTRGQTMTQGPRHSHPPHRRARILLGATAPPRRTCLPSWRPDLTTQRELFTHVLAHGDCDLACRRPLAAYCVEHSQAHMLRCLRASRDPELSACTTPGAPGWNLNAPEKAFTHTGAATGTVWKFCSDARKRKHVRMPRRMGSRHDRLLTDDPE